MTLTMANRYLRIRLGVLGKNRTYAIHRLVAEAFIPNPDNKPQVNHLDGNRINNRAENLEWVTQLENNIHAHNMKLVPLHMRRKAIVAYNETDSICFSTTTYAFKEYPFTTSNISRALKSGRPHNGYLWASLDDFLKLGPHTPIQLHPERIGVKLCLAEVREVKAKALAGVKYASISRDYGISNSAIYRIRNGLSWPEA
jgi:hypothetical protein